MHFEGPLLRDLLETPELALPIIRQQTLFQRHAREIWWRRDDNWIRSPGETETKYRIRLVCLQSKKQRSGEEKRSEANVNLHCELLDSQRVQHSW